MLYPAPIFEKKLCPPEQLIERLVSLPRPLVFTNGCFDLLHRGHVTYLAQARALGASLIVGVNTDASIRRLGKGDDRPIHAQDDRAAMLAALESVSLVTWFDEDTPASLLTKILPDVLVKGGDWPSDKIVGGQSVLARGGAVYSIPFVFHTSTTALVKKIRSSQVE